MLGFEVDWQLNNMNVNFDISVLGKGFYFQTARTGVFRVIENLVQELVEQQVIASFSSVLSIGSYYESLDYLQQSPSLSSIPLIKPEVSAHLLDGFKFLHRKLHSNAPVPFAAKVVARFVNSRFVSRAFLKQPMMNSALVGADIYHSPYFPIPDQVRQDRRIKKIITVYDLIPLLYPQFFGKGGTGFIEKVLASIERDVWVTCISLATKMDLCNHLPSLDPDKVFVTPLAASALFYQCRDSSVMESVRARIGIPRGPYVLSLSTLEPRKNIPQTIRSFAKLVEEESIDDLSLVLVGTKGWDFEPIFSEISSNRKIRERIIVTGYVDDEYLAPLYSGAMMFVYPSLYEGFGLPPLEAMQCGVPVITSNTSSLPEVVGDAGIMVQPRDGDALCQAMLKIYRSAELRQKMSTDSLERAAKFSWKKCADLTIDAYKASLTAE